MHLKKLLFTFLIPASVLADQAAPAAAGVQNSTAAGDTTPAGLDSEWFDKKMGPFSFAAGPATGGGFGVSLVGDQAKALPFFDYSNLPSRDNSHADWYYAMHPSIGYSLDGILTTKTQDPNNASIKLSPSIDFGLYKGLTAFCKEDLNKSDSNDFCRDILPESKLGFGFSGDFRYRYGSFKQGSGLAKANQAIIGGSVYIVPSIFRGEGWKWILVVPQITETYYKPVSTQSSTVSVPSDIKADYLQSEFHTQLGTTFGMLKEVNGKFPAALDITYDGTQPTTGADRAWQSLWKLQLSIAINGSSLKPAVTYQSGTEGGFQYSQQVLIGFAMDFLNPPK